MGYSSGMAKVNIYQKYQGKKIPFIVEEGEDGFLIAECPLFSGCYTQGKTFEKLLKNMKEVLELVLEDKENQDILKDYNFKKASLHTITL